MLKLNTDYKIVKVTNTDFKMRSKFSVDVKILTYEENMDLMENNKVGDTEKLDIMPYAKALFSNSIVSWEGIADDEGKTLECTNENKLLIFKFHPDFCQELIEKASEKVGAIKKKS